MIMFLAKSEYIRCYTPFASWCVVSADSVQKQAYLFSLLLNSKASLYVFTASYTKVLKIQVK